MRFFFHGLMVALMGICLIVPHASHAGTVKVRAGAHPDHDRLVLDWPNAPPYHVTGAPPTYTIEFDQPAKFALPAVSGLSRVADVSQSSPTTLVVRVKPGQSLSVSAYSKKLVLDVVAAKPAKPSESDKVDQAKKEGSSSDAAESEPHENSGPDAAPAPVPMAAKNPVKLTPWSENEEFKDSTAKAKTPPKKPAKPPVVPAELTQQMKEKLAAMPPAPQAITKTTPSISSTAEAAPVAIAQTQTPPAASSPPPAAAPTPPALATVTPSIEKPSAAVPALPPVPLQPEKPAEKPPEKKDEKSNDTSAATMGPGGRPLTLAELAAQQNTKKDKGADSKKADDKSVPANGAAPNKSAAVDDKGAADAKNFGALQSALPTPSALAQIKLPIPKNAKFSAFVRARNLWVVLDMPSLDLPTDENGGQTDSFGPVTRYQVAQGSGTAYRIQLRENQFPAFTKFDGGSLFFTLYNQEPLVMPVGLPVETENSTDSGPRLKITAAGFATPIRITDADIGDQLIVIPADPDTGAVSTPHRWPQLSLLPAMGGVVIKPWIDNLVVDTNRKGAIIARPPNGLVLSGIKGIIDRKDKGQGEQIFNLKAWRQTSFANFLKRKAQLESSLAETRGAERLNKIIQLARFLFAQGYPQEANGWLRIAAQDFPATADVPEFVLLRGAVHVAMRDVFPADRDLSLSGYAYEPEVALWRGWAAAQNEDYTRARYFFGLARDWLNDYPDPYFRPIAFAAAETALQTGDAAAAGALIARIGAGKNLLDVDKNQLNYLKGLQARINGQDEEATKLLEEAAKGSNKIYAAKAEFAAVEHGLEHKTLKEEEAIKRLDHLRYQWRGDSLELATLNALAPLLLNNGNTRGAFECWQTLIRYFPSQPQAEMARQQISQHLADLFTNTSDQDQKPIEAIALYRDFIGYAPTPEVKDSITRQLINNLTNVGMYQEAADIYQPLVLPKIDPAAKDAAPAGPPSPADVLRLAGIYLLDGQAQPARKTLALVERAALKPPEMAEHRLLSARANVVENKLDEALTELGDLKDENAARMRVDIFWRQKKWPDAAAALADVTGAPAAEGAEATPEQVQNIMARAVALSLAENPAGLAELRTRYGAMMDKTDQAAAFRLITLPPKGSELQSIRSIQSRLGDVDEFAAFLQKYRK